jgi:hypothetical protein
VRGSRRVGNEHEYCDVTERKLCIVRFVWYEFACHCVGLMSGVCNKNNNNVKLYRTCAKSEMPKIQDVDHPYCPSFGLPKKCGIIP